MRFLIGLTLVAAAMACVHKNEKYKDGDTWVVRSTFVMKCRIEANGSWSTKIVGCRTAGGVVVAPGEVIKEGDTTYECTAKSDGRVEIRRTHHFNRQRVSCEGHSLGESWVSQQNFRKSCTESGARITECLTDAGIAVPLNQHLVLSGIIYTCTRFPNGTVTVNREGLPSPSNFKSNLKPVEVLGPMWKKFRSLGSLLQSEEESEKRPHLVPASLRQLELPTSNEFSPIKCISNGVTYYPEETWVSENKFTKKCTPDGSIIILNCLVDDRNTINVNTEVKLGRSVSSDVCFVKMTGTRSGVGWSCNCADK